MTKTNPKYLNHKKSKKTKKGYWAYDWAYDWAYGSAFESTPNCPKNDPEKPLFDAKHPPIVPVYRLKNGLNTVENRQLNPKNRNLCVRVWNVW